VIKKGLGRGLEALLPEIEVHEEDRIHEIPVREVSPNPYQPRRSFDEAKIEELAASIKEYGVLQPIILRRLAGGYQLVAGERRFRAVKKIGLETIPAVIRDIQEERLMEIALIENLQREDLNPIDEALAYSQLMKDFGLTQEQLAEKLGKSRSQIANYARFLQLSDHCRKLLADGEITAGHAKVLAGVEDLIFQAEIADLIVREELSVRQTEEMVEHRTRRQTKKRNKGSEALPPEIADLEDALKVRVGALVRLTYNQGKGKIEIPYASGEELERIFELLMQDSPVGEKTSGPKGRKEFVV